MVQEEESCIEQGPRRAHAGTMAAATAIWKDLRVHRILPALLNVSSDDEDNPEYDIGAGMQSSSLEEQPTYTHIYRFPTHIHRFCMTCVRRQTWSSKILEQVCYVIHSMSLPPEGA